AQAHRGLGRRGGDSARQVTGVVHSPVGVRAACIDVGSNTTRLLVADCVDGELAEARAHGAGEIRGVATAAIRTASNGVALVEAIAAGTGLQVEIVSGEDEA